MIYAFEGFELDTDLFQLRRGAEVVKLDRKAFDTLIFLVEHRDRVVQKGELLEQLWPNEVVVDAVLPAAIRRIRRALGQDSRDGGPIETSHGRGYRFVAEARAVERARFAVETAVAPPPQMGSDEPPEPFVGRGDVLGSVRAAYESARAGRGRLILLFGEAGIGKTRLARHAKNEMRTRGMRAWASTCYEGQGAPSFWPWIQLLRGALTDLPLDTVAPVVLGDLAALVPEVRGQAAQVPAGPPVDRDAGRFRLYDSVARFFGAGEPKMLVLDDLQWADGPSLELLDFIAGQLDGMPLVIVGTVRSEELSKEHPSRPRLDRLARYPGCSRIEIQALTKGDVREYLGALLGVAPSEDLAETMFARSGGNPLFLRELANLLPRLQAAVAEPDASDLELPDAAKDVLRRRLQRVSPRTVRALEVVSVIGRPFDLALLKRAASRDGGELLSALDEALQAGLLVWSNAGRWAFSHDLLRDTVYQDLSLDERSRLHLAVASALEEQLTTGRSSLSEVASHYCRALPHDRAERAANYARRAAEAAEKVHADADAARFYQLALDALAFSAEPSQKLYAELYLALGRSLVASGSMNEAFEQLSKAQELARQIDSPVLLAEAALALRPIHRLWHLTTPETHRVLKEALEQLPADNRRLRARILASLATTLPQALDMNERRRMTAEALSLAGDDADFDTVVAVQVARMHSLQGPDDIDALLGETDEIIRGAAARTAPQLEPIARTFRALAFLTLGDLAGARGEHARLTKLTAELRNPLDEWRLAVVAPSRHLAEGRFAEAEQSIRDAYRLGKRVLGRPARLSYSAQLTMLRYELGQLPMLRGVDLSGFREEFKWAGSGLHANLAWFDLEVGRIDEARRGFDELALADFADIPRAAGYLATMRTLCLLAFGLRDLPRAEVLLERLEPYRELHVLAETFLYLGPVAHYVGLLQSLLGRRQSALESFELAIEKSDQRHARPIGIRSRFELGKCLLQSSRETERRRGRELVVGAHHGAAELGMAGVEAATRTVMHEAVRDR